MRLGLRHLPLLAAPVLLTACPSTGYEGPVEVPQVEAAVPVGAYVSLGPFLRGRYAPAPAMGVSAKCVDDSMCDVAVVGSEVRVGGKKPGRAEVVVAYKEADGQPGASRVFVNFADGLLDPIEPGKQTYAPEVLQTLEQVQLGGRKANFACARDGAPNDERELGEKLDLGSPGRGNARLFTCLEARKLGSTDAYYRFSSLGVGYTETSTPEERVIVCAHARPESSDYLSLSIYQYIDGVPVLLERRGEASDVCALAHEGPARPSATARIVAIEASKEGAVGKSVTFELSAPAGAGCDVAGYELRWPGGAKSLDLQGVHVDGGATDRRTLQLDLSNGDLVSLDVKEARVIPRATCR